MNEKITIPGFAEVETGANFSADRKYRYSLWRIWDRSKPLVMFIGLNPSTANESDNDPTIKSVIRISKHNGYGGVYMMNCFPYISTDPGQLFACSHSVYNEELLKETAEKCQDVVFAWGNFQVVQKLGVDFIKWSVKPIGLVQPMGCKRQTLR